jgi:hypothetical protein
MTVIAYGLNEAAQLQILCSNSDTSTQRDS